jgi:hypothetical protein
MAAVVKPQASYFGGETGSKKPDSIQFIGASIKHRWATKMLKMRKGAAAESAYDILG